MKIALWIILYFVVGIIVTAIVSKNFRKVRGYSIRDFDDLDDDEQGIMIATALVWPIMICLFAIYVILDGITKITNRKDGDSK